MYLLTSSSNVQTISPSNDFSTLIKYSISALEVDSNVTIPLTLAAATVTAIPVLSIIKIQLIAIKSTLPVDLSLKQVAGADVFLGFPSTYHLIVHPEGLAFSHIKLLAAAATPVEIVIGGKFT